MPKPSCSPPPPRARSALEGEVSLSACAKETEGVRDDQAEPAGALGGSVSTWLNVTALVMGVEQVLRWHR
jgi:hypothetical protein